MNLSANRISRPLAPHLERVLLMESSQANARMIADLIKDLGAQRLYVETAEASALETCRQLEPQLIITELSGPKFDALRFTRNLRRSGLSCRRVPVIVITADATAGAILGARNVGVHEFLRKPFTIRDLTRRIEAVMLRGRDWIEAMNYVGPDRRRFNSGGYQGHRKRRADAESQETADGVERALRILKSAFAAVETDPVQARRSIQAQAADLHAIAMRSNDLKLIGAVAPLQRALAAMGDDGALSRPVLEAAAAPLWIYLPTEDGSKARAAG